MIEEVIDDGGGCKESLAGEEKGKGCLVIWVPHRLRERRIPNLEHGLASRRAFDVAVHHCSSQCQNTNYCGSLKGCAFEFKRNNSFFFFVIVQWQQISCPPVMTHEHTQKLETLKFQVERVLDFLDLPFALTRVASVRGNKVLSIRGNEVSLSSIRCTL